MKRSIVLVCILLSGCHDFWLDDDYYCNEDDGPLFTVDALPEAILNQEYTASFKAHIPTRSNDDEHSYFFDFDGDLPNGIEYDRSGREIVFSGTPTELGTYEFNLEVDVLRSELSLNDDEFCYTKYDQDFVLTVNVM